jgi:hypothetical protein
LKPWKHTETGESGFCSCPWGKKVKGGAQDFSLFSLWVVVAACREDVSCLSAPGRGGGRCREDDSSGSPSHLLSLIDR